MYIHVLNKVNIGKLNNQQETNGDDLEKASLVKFSWKIYFQLPCEAFQFICVALPNYGGCFER